MRTKHLVVISLLLLLLLGVFVGLPYYHDAQLPRATAILQIHPTPIGNAGSLRTGPGSSGTDHFEQILDPKTLSLAIKSLQFGIPANDEEVKSLKSQLEVSPVRGTDFIHITAKHQSPERAALIANSVAEAYLTRQEEIERERTKATLKAFDDEMIAQLELTHDHWLAFLTICKQLGLEGPFFKDNPPNLSNLKFVPVKNEPTDPHHEFKRTKKLFLDATEVLRELEMKRQEFKASSKDRAPIASIHKRAK